MLFTYDNVLICILFGFFIKIVLDVKKILSGDEGQKAIATRVQEKRDKSKPNQPVVLIIGAGAAGLSVIYYKL